MLIRMLFIALALLIPFRSSGCQESSPASISVPQGKPLAVDGTVSPGEWHGAAVETFSDGSEHEGRWKNGHFTGE